MLKLIAEFEAACANRAFQLVDEKAAGGTIVEYTGTFVPEEIIHAAGAASYPMWIGGQPEPVDAVLDESLRFLTPLVRTPYGLIKMGLDPVAEICDIYAQSITDVQSARISELVERAGFPVCKISVPADWTTEQDLAYYKERICRFITMLENKSGKSITDAELKAAIDKYNKIRGLLRELSSLRMSDCPVLKGSEFIRIDHCAAIADPDTSIDYLQKILSAAKEAVPADGKRPRIILFGKAVAIGDYYVVRALEDAGCDIVFEILDEAYLHFDNDVSVNGDPLDAIIANRYRDRLPNIYMQPSWEQRCKALLEAVAIYRAEGVVLYDLLYDEIADMESNILSDALGKAGIPVVRLQTSYEYTREAMGPMRTRVETFAASLKGGKKQ